MIIFREMTFLFLFNLTFKFTTSFLKLQIYQYKNLFHLKTKTYKNASLALQKPVRQYDKYNYTKQ